MLLEGPKRGSNSFDSEDIYGFVLVEDKEKAKEDDVAGVVPGIGKSPTEQRSRTHFRLDTRTLSRPVSGTGLFRFKEQQCRCCINGVSEDEFEDSSVMFEDGWLQSEIVCGICISINGRISKRGERGVVSVDSEDRNSFLSFKDKDSRKIGEGAVTGTEGSSLGQQQRGTSSEIERFRKRPLVALFLKQRFSFRGIAFFSRRSKNKTSNSRTL